MNKIGVAAIIFAIATLITAMTTVIVNFATFKWSVKIYTPFGKFIKKAEPLMDKMLKCSDRMLDQYIEDFEED